MSEKDMHLCKKEVNSDRVLTRKLQLGPSGPNWERECSRHARVSTSKCSWGVQGVCFEPPPLQQGS